MISRLKSSRKKFLILIIVAVLVPFACRQLLAFGLHVSRNFTTCVYANGAAGHHSSRHLIHQLDVQALDQDKTSPVLLPHSSPGIFGKGFFPRKFLAMDFHSGFARAVFPSGDSVSLRI